MTIWWQQAGTQIKPEKDRICDSFSVSDNKKIKQPYNLLLIFYLLSPSLRVLLRIPVIDLESVPDSFLEYDDNLSLVPLK